MHGYIDIKNNTIQIGRHSMKNIMANNKTAHVVAAADSNSKFKWFNKFDKDVRKKHEENY